MDGTERMAVGVILQKNEQALLDVWRKEQLAAGSKHVHLLSEAELRQQSREFLSLMVQHYKSGGGTDIYDTNWAPVREYVADLARHWAVRGLSSSEAVRFFLSLKHALFDLLRQEMSQDLVRLVDTVGETGAWLDKLGLYASEIYQQGREDVIKRQQAEILELSTPVVRIWDGILTLPLIGTLDSSRTQGVMESLLQSIVDTNSSIAIIDITGVPLVDTLVAQHLLKTVAAARLMGAQCVISGIRPQIAQTMVQLGVTFEEIVTKASLADALAYAFRQLGLSVTRITERS